MVTAFNVFMINAGGFSRITYDPGAEPKERGGLAMHAGGSMILLARGWFLSAGCILYLFAVNLTFKMMLRQSKITHYPGRHDETKIIQAFRTWLSTIYANFSGDISRQLREPERLEKFLQRLQRSLRGDAKPADAAESREAA